jgi:hypothetical protein
MSEHRGAESAGHLRVVALVPAMNEAERIGETVDALLSIDEVSAVLVIDDGSTDETADRARASGASVLRFRTNRGQAHAIMAGATTITDADIFLIVDGDVGTSAVHARDLVTPVVLGDADMTIAVLPLSATGGFGIVRRTAQWGVRRATGLQLRAPISGQRAIRAGLLRSMSPTTHFGFSVSLSIDAARAGARILEIEVPLTHRHTGKTVRGFVHRGKQGLWLLRALWPRLTSSRFRIGAAALALVLIASALLFSGARHARPKGTTQGPASKVVIFGMPGLTWDELRTQTPNLRRLVDEGSIAAQMVKTTSGNPATQESYASLGAGAPVKAGLPAALVLPAGTEFESDTAANAVARRVGRQPRGEIVVMGAAEALLKNEDLHSISPPGALGDALLEAGRRTAVVGNADIEFFDNSLEFLRRPTAVAVMNGTGSVDTGSVGRELLMADPKFAYGRRADPRAVLDAFDAALADADVVVVDPGDLDRADEQQDRLLPDAATASRARAVAATDAILGEVVDRLDRDTLLIVAGIRPPKGEWRLAPVVAHGPGVPNGYIDSRGTHRSGVVTLYDLAPTVLQALGIEVPPDFIGTPVRYEATRPDLERLQRLDRDATFRTRAYNATTTAFIVIQALTYLLVALVAFVFPADRWKRPLRWLVLGILAYPAATFLFRAIPNVVALGFAGLTLVFVLDAVIVIVARRVARLALGQVAFILSLTIALLIFDVATGNNLHLSGLMGLSLNIAGRYYGFGNSSLALLAAASIMLVAIYVELSRAKREAAIVGSLLLFLVLLADGAPVLGNDIGGIITLAPVFTVVVARLMGWRITWRTVVVGVIVAVGALTLVGAIELSRSSDAQTHFGKLIDSVRDEGLQPLSDTVQRKLGAIVRLLQGSVWVWLIPVGFAFLVYVLGWRARWRELLAHQPVLRLGLLAALAAGLWGSMVNDSGPIVIALVLTVVCPIVSLVALDFDTGPVLLAPTVDPDARPRAPAMVGEPARS